jgi:hypothetical protein
MTSLTPISITSRRRGSGLILLSRSVDLVAPSMVEHNIYFKTLIPTTPRDNVGSKETNNKRKRRTSLFEVQQHWTSSRQRTN